MLGELGRREDSLSHHCQALRQAYKVMTTSSWHTAICTSFAFQVEKKNGRGTIFVKDKIPRELSHCGPGLTSERYLVLRDLAGFHPEGAARVATFHPSCCNGPYIRNKQRWSQGASESCLDWTISLGHCMFPTVQSCGIPWVECLLWLWSLFGYPYGFSTSPVDLERCSGYTGLVKIRPGCLIYLKEQNQGYLCGVWMWLLVLKVFFFFLFSQQNSTRQC